MLFDFIDHQLGCAASDGEGRTLASEAMSVADFDASLGGFLLPYEAVRKAADSDQALLGFLQSTYEAAARLAHWERQALECPLGAPRVPREV